MDTIHKSMELLGVSHTLSHSGADVQDDVYSQSLDSPHRDYVPGHTFVDLIEEIKHLILIVQPELEQTKCRSMWAATPLLHHYMFMRLCLGLAMHIW